MDPSLLDPAHCVANNLHQTARAVSRIYAQEMQAFGLRRSQFSLLSHLERCGPIAIGALAERMYMERTTLTRNLRPLEREGLVVRTAGTDARVKELQLSARGAERLAAARAGWRRAQRRVVGAFGEADWGALEQTLRKLREVVPEP
jgi:DNA-binding MarR family transcriptional regulator